jgi:hypothetical protein
MNTISAKNKGLITGALILLLSAITYYIKRSFDNYILLVAYTIYAAGIVWTLLAFHNQKEQSHTFKDYFQQGFKCFIIVTLMMVCATWFFMKFNVSLQNEMVDFQRQQLKLDNNYSEPDIEEKLKQYRKILLPGYTIGAILSYLGIGTLITSLLSVFLNGIKRA